MIRVRQGVRCRSPYLGITSSYDIYIIILNLLYDYYTCYVTIRLRRTYGSTVNLNELEQAGALLLVYDYHYISLAILEITELTALIRSIAVHTRTGTEFGELHIHTKFVFSIIL